MLSRVLGAVSPLVSAVRDCFRHRIGKRGRQKLFAILGERDLPCRNISPRTICPLFPGPRERDFALCDALAETESALWPNCEVVGRGRRRREQSGRRTFYKVRKEMGKTRDRGCPLMDWGTHGRLTMSVRPLTVNTLRLLARSPWSFACVTRALFPDRILWIAFGSHSFHS